MNRIIAVTASAALALSPLALTAPSYAAPARADSWTVTATISDTVAIGKETILKVRGRVTPKAAGQKVVLQQRVGTKKAWKATGSAKVKRNGTYLLKDMPSTAGTRSYRVLKPASNGLRKGLSKPIEVDVYRWGKLTMRPVGPSENLIPDHVYIGTDYYSRSLVNTEAGVPASIEFTLGRKCLELLKRGILGGLTSGFMPPSALWAHRSCRSRTP